jgi:hypothetical protein
MRPQSDVSLVLALLDDGLTALEISRRTRDEIDEPRVRAGSGRAGRRVAVLPGDDARPSALPPRQPTGRRRPELSFFTRGGGSSVGRAPGCGPGGRGFKSRPPPLVQPGPVAQRIERRTSNPCAEVRLLPGPFRGQRPSRNRSTAHGPARARAGCRAGPSPSPPGACPPGSRAARASPWHPPREP